MLTRRQVRKYLLKHAEQAVRTERADELPEDSWLLFKVGPLYVSLESDRDALLVSAQPAARWTDKNVYTYHSGIWWRDTVFIRRFITAVTGEPSPAHNLHWTDRLDLSETQS